MKKKRTVVRYLEGQGGGPRDERTWNNGSDIELLLYGRALREAARKIAESQELRPVRRKEWDAAPAILLYRHTLELQLKALVGEGSHFLASPVDPITLYKTHSIRWLAQIVCQVIRAVGWEEEFQCEGIPSLRAFQALVDEVEAADPVELAIRGRGRDGRVPQSLEAAKVLDLAGRLERLLDLLGSITDSLAVEWDLLVSGEEEWPVEAPGKFTVH